MSRPMDKRPYSLRLTLLTGLLLFVAVAGALWAAHRTVAPLLVAEMQKNSAAVGRSVVKQFSGAVASGIPLAKLAGVDEMLEAVIGDNPSLNAIEVTDPQGRILFTSGDKLPADDRGGASPLTRPVVSSLPITVNGTTVGTLRVGSDLSFMADRVWLYLATTLGVILASLLLVHEVARLILARAIDTPSAQLGAALRTILEGDYSTAVVSSAPGTMGRAIRKLNTNLRAVTDRFERFAASANAIRGLDLDAASADRLSRMLEDAKLRFPTLMTEAGRPALPPPARPDGRWVLLLLALLSEMIRPLVPVIGADRSLTGLDPALLAAVPLGLNLVGIGFGVVLAPLVRPSRRTSVFLLMLVLVALSLVIVAASPSAVVFWTCRLAAGIGLGLAWRLLSQRYRTDILQDSRTLLIAGLGFHAVGPMIGAVIGESFGVQSALWFFAAASVASGLYGWNSLRHLPEITDPETEEQVDTPRLWSAGIMAVIIGAVLFGTLPVQGLTSGTLMASVPFYALFGVGILVGFLAAGPQSRRTGTGLLLAAVGLTLFILLPDVIGAGLGLLLLGGGWGAMRTMRPSSGLILIDSAGGLIGISLAALTASAHMPDILLSLSVLAAIIGGAALLRPQSLVSREP